MRLFLASVMVAIISLVSASSSAQTWGPSCVGSTTEGAMRWYGPELHVFDAGLSGCFEENGRCAPDAQALRLVNVSPATIWVRIDSSGDVLRLGSGARMLLSLNNRGGVVTLAVRSCSSTGFGNRRLVLGASQYGFLAQGATIRYDVAVMQEQVVSIRLMSPVFDTYLRLYQGGRLVAVNDDISTENLDSEVLVFLTEGLYTIEVSSFNNMGGGDFVLRTQGVD